MLTKDELKDKAIRYLEFYRNDMVLLQTEREEWLKYYFQDETLYENPEGRSSVITSDVFEVVEAAMPALMDIFWGGADVVQCSPQGPEDEQSAKQMEILLNHQVQREMNGYKELHDWFKDALLQKIGFVKFWWEARVDYQKKDYEGLNEAEFAYLQGQPDYEIRKIEQITVQEAVVDVFGTVLSPQVLAFNVQGRTKEKISHPVFQFVPADEVIFDIHSTSIKDMAFICHRKKVHKSYLGKYGVNEDLADAKMRGWENDQLTFARFKDLGGTTFWRDTENNDFVYLYECYFCDYDKKGNKVAKKLTLFGNEVLDVEDNSYGRPTFCALSPIGIPGRLVGRGMAELATDTQDVSTALTRSILDNCYYDLLGMRIVNPFRLDPQTLIEGNRPGGLGLTKDDVDPSTCIHEMKPNQLPPHVFSMLEMQESRKENKTGVNKYSMGSDSREVNRTATGVAMLTSNAQQRTKQIARNFAETGVKDLFQCLMQMNLDYLDKSVAIRLDKGWQEINPLAIKGKFDIRIDVGLGTGQKEIKVQQMMQMLQLSGPMLQVGIVSPQNIQEMLKTIYELWGYKSADKYINVELQQQMMMQQQQMAMMGGMNAGLPAGGPGEIAPTGGSELMAGPGGQGAPQPRIDPRILQALQGASPQPLV